MNILVINSGSSSIKYTLFDMPAEKCLMHGVIEHIAEKGSKIKDHYEGLKIVLGRVKRVDLVGHRVVHGAEKFKKPILINPSVIRKIRDCSRLAPLHNPANLAGIMACKKLLPGVRQTAVFDTAFHQTLPDYAYVYGLPYSYYKRFGIRKYGFHGTSHEYVAHEAARRLGRPGGGLKLITCHLGNGCSIAAVDRGRSIDTSMGFTPLEGLVMGTRCGDIDPALVTYIMQREKLDIAQIEAILNKSSGLKGVSGVSNDMRVLEARARTRDGRAKLAVDIFIYRIKKYIGAYTAVMSGCDCLVFTGGIGENQKRVRDEICKGLFSHLRKKPRIMVIPTNEELMIARKSCKLVR
ncbi:MAG: acetate kinase [Candidatus Omnitrophota bacterium]|jgi:acetate kinase